MQSLSFRGSEALPFCGGGYLHFNSHQAIQSFDQDLLEREAFVKSVAQRLILKKRSTGIVLGLVGPWGCGKSSILNLLERHIAHQYANVTPLIVRFNPWLVSGRNDLISQFFLELAEALRSHLGVYDVYDNGRQQRQDKAIKAMRDYGDELSPILRMISPSLAAGSNILTRWAKASNAVSESIFTKRKEVKNGLKAFDFPIVVLIDEMDRIEDEEIQDMAKLLKAVGDFDEISYVVAYDEDRVAQALSGGSEDLERGHNYLEKIVQIRVASPFLTSEEIERLFHSKIKKCLDFYDIKIDSHDTKRLDNVLKIAVPEGVKTSRDINRIIQDFAGRLVVLENLVNPVDCLAFCILDNKNSATIRRVENRLLSRYSNIAFETLPQYSSYLEFKRYPRGLLFRNAYISEGKAWHDRLCDILWPYFRDHSERDTRPATDRVYTRPNLIALMKHSSDELRSELNRKEIIASQLCRGQVKKVFSKGGMRRGAATLLLAEPLTYNFEEKQLRIYVRSIGRWIEQECVRKSSRGRITARDLLIAGCSVNRSVKWNRLGTDPAKLVATLIKDNSLFLASTLLIENDVAQFMYEQNPYISGTQVADEQVIQLRGLFRKRVSTQDWKTRLEFSGPLIFGLDSLSNEDRAEDDKYSIFEICENQGLMASVIPMLFHGFENRTQVPRNAQFSYTFLKALEYKILNNEIRMESFSEMEEMKFVKLLIRGSNLF